MTASSLKSFSRATMLVAAGALVWVFTPGASAQPANNSANQFGDRQAGQWGDPSQGYFGNPAVGNFDSSQVRVPPAGARAMGRVQEGRNVPVSPYISLPQPEDAATEAPGRAPVTSSKPVKTSKKPPAKKKPG